tara:strand:+ start:433 stop:861 length:429 start_codon:yes stop_codon:yes gene_type:complete
MPSRDITTSTKKEIAVNVQAIATDTTTVGNIIDTSDIGGINFTLFSGAYTDGSYVILLEESDNSDLSSSNVVADGDMLGQDAASSTSPELQTVIGAANLNKKIGYVGIKRYVRPSIVSTSTTTGATLGCIVDEDVNIKPATV